MIVCNMRNINGNSGRSPRRSLATHSALCSFLLFIYFILESSRTEKHLNLFRCGWFVLLSQFYCSIKILCALLARCQEGKEGEQELLLYRDFVNLLSSYYKLFCVSGAGALAISQRFFLCDSRFSISSQLDLFHSFIQFCFLFRRCFVSFSSGAIGCARCSFPAPQFSYELLSHLHSILFYFSLWYRKVDSNWADLVFSGTFTWFWFAYERHWDAERRSQKREERERKRETRWLIGKRFDTDWAAHAFGTHLTPTKITCSVTGAVILSERADWECLRAVRSLINAKINQFYW